MPSYLSLDDDAPLRPEGARWRYLVRQASNEGGKDRRSGVLQIRAVAGRGNARFGKTNESDAEHADGGDGLGRDVNASPDLYEGERRGLIFGLGPNDHLPSRLDDSAPLSRASVAR